MEKSITIIIPCYEMGGMGHTFLDFSLSKLCEQDYKNFDVVISDNSLDGLVEKVCDKYKHEIKIRYIRNNVRKGCSANLNVALQYAKGDLIKFLFQDDFLYNEYSLRMIANHFLDTDNWLVTACEHSNDGARMIRPFYPRYNKDLYLGNNTISSPSVLTIRNKDVMKFDENLVWLLDCDYYKRLYDKYGEPKIVDIITVVNRVGAHQVTNSVITDEIIKKEYNYVKEKYVSRT